MVLIISLVLTVFNSVTSIPLFSAQSRPKVVSLDNEVNTVKLSLPHLLICNIKRILLLTSYFTGNCFVFPPQTTAGAIKVQWTMFWC